MKNLICIGAVVTLSACGGTSEPVTTARADFAVANLQHYELASNVYEFSGIGGANFPTSGSASFNGSATVYVTADNDGKAYSMIGDSKIDANFRTSAVTGRLDNFVVHERDENGDFSTYATSGAIRIGERESRIGDPDPDDNFSYSYDGLSADYRGTVQTPDGGLWFNGELNGRFVGTRVNQPAGETIVRGLYAGDFKPDGVIVDGERALTEIEIIATAAN